MPSIHGRPYREPAIKEKEPMNENELFLRCFKIGAWCVGIVFLMGYGQCLTSSYMDNSAKVKVAQSCPPAAESKK